jgi:uncharacterized membrane protein (DUF485 family)
MADWDHGANSPDESETEESIARNSRVGLILFFIYLVFYVGFVLMNTFAPDLVEKPTFGGLNVAITYGFALIVLALVLALIYGWLCRLPASVEEGDGK